jgi:succinate dehydrogenase / fumarate reductase cytochrome b subunit
MNLLNRIWNSSLGKKYIMAVTGGALFVFVVGHLLGNLQVFLPKEKINAYSQFLRSNLALLWTVRLGLLACVVLHIVAAARLSAENKAARGLGYEGNPVPPATSYASRTMLMSGLIVAAFVIYHLLHFTWQAQWVNFIGKDFDSPEFTAILPNGSPGHDVHRMMVEGFQRGTVMLFYLVGVGLLCLHLSHGLSAMFQSMGWRNQRWTQLLERCARVASWLIFLGYASIPVALWLRLVPSH